MAGIYIHIPFCSKKCYYCDFFVSISQKYKNEYIEALKEEIKLRKNYLHNNIIETLYFGGGTPSLLDIQTINSIIDVIKTYHTFSEKPEITIEANPDDLSKSFLSELKETDINRLSIGIQSFFDDDLNLMNRRHNSEQSIQSIINSKEYGFTNLSIDLIYGLPGMTIEKWKKNLQIFFKYNIPHLSAYHLTYEPKTVFYKFLKTRKIKQITEEESLKQFDYLSDSCYDKGYIHYETSNFAKEGFISRHNSSYWQQKKYLGIGAAAHSYDGYSRQNNIADIKQFIYGVFEKKEYFSKEILTERDKYNDYIITSLRTIWGIDMMYIKDNFERNYYNHFKKESFKYLKKGLLIQNGNIISTSKAGKFIEDRIIEDLFFQEDEPTM